MDPPNSTEIVGWTADGGGRGTWKLLWTSLATIFLAIVVACHPPAGYKPSQGTRYGIGITTYHVWRFTLAIYSLTLPEFMITVALGELVEAQNFREEIRSQASTAFTLQEAFFACMGGYRIRDISTDDLLEVSGFLGGRRSDFGLLPSGVAWLVKAGIVGMPKRDHAEIRDKPPASAPSTSVPGTTSSKDSTSNKEEAKADDIPVTQSASPQAFLVDSWTIEQRSRSDGVAKAIVILQCTYFIISCIGRGANQLPLSLLEVLVLSYIVLTFVSYAVWWYKPQNVQEAVVLNVKLTDQQWQELEAVSGITSSLGISPGGIGLTEPTDMDLKLSRTLLIQFWSFILACWASAGIHFAGWNYDFPSTTEKTIWRVFSIILIALPIFMVADSRILGHGRGRLFPQKVNGWIQALFVTIGVVAKIGLFILALLSLRAAPKSIYDTWEISNWLLFWL